MGQIIPMAVDLSHWDPADDYEAVLQDGIVGVIYKATEGVSYTDDTYVGQQHAAKRAGLKWGSYHFADALPVSGQINNYLRFAAPDPDEIFCLDWEDNPSGNGRMSLNDVKTWITEVERALGRDGQCVLYSGNTAKEQLGDRVDTFLGARRLWLAHYSSSPSWQRSWDHFWLHQFTDGEYGPSPHAIDGIGPCDINSYVLGPAEQLVAEWATGSADVTPPEPEPDQTTVGVLIAAPPGVIVKVRQLQLSGRDQRPQRSKEAGAD